MQTSVTPAIVDTTDVVREYGPAPLPQPRFDPERLRTSLTDTSIGTFGGLTAEVRTSETASAMGIMQSQRDWDALTRLAKRREVGNAPEIRVRRSDDHLVIDYASTFPIDNIWAEWMDGGKSRHGSISVPFGTRGTATIRDDYEIWPEHEPFIWDVDMPPPQENVRVLVLLAQRSSSGRRAFLWSQTDDLRPFFIRDREKVTGGSASFLFALPQNLPPAASALVAVPKNRASMHVTLHLASGDVALAPTGRNGVLFMSTAYAIPQDALRAIVAQGGVASVTMSTDENATHPAWRKSMETAAIEIREQKP